MHSQHHPKRDTSTGFPLSFPSAFWAPVVEGRGEGTQHVIEDNYKFGISAVVSFCVADAVNRRSKSCPNCSSMDHLLYSQLGAVASVIFTGLT